MEREEVGGSDSADDNERRDIAKAADEIIRAMSAWVPGIAADECKVQLDFYDQRLQMSPLRFQQLILT